MLGADGLINGLEFEFDVVGAAGVSIIEDDRLAIFFLVPIGKCPAEFVARVLIVGGNDDQVRAFSSVAKFSAESPCNQRMSSGAARTANAAKIYA